MDRILRRIKLGDKSIFDNPTWRHRGALMQLVRTSSLDVEKKENRQKAVAGNLSTNNTFKAWAAADTARLVRLLTNHAPIGASHSLSP